MIRGPSGSRSIRHPCEMPSASRTIRTHWSLAGIFALKSFGFPSVLMDDPPQIRTSGVHPFWIVKGNRVDAAELG